MTNVNKLYELSINQCVDAISSIASKRTVLVQGHMGSGKSSILSILANKHKTHTPVYFDCTTKDLGDIALPNFDSVKDCVQFTTNEELGVHIDGPIILMVDEYGKANPAVKNALLRLMLERKIGSRKLHEDSLIFATTNLGAEGVGDLLPPHARNRITTVTMRKPNALEWIEWGINNGVHHTLLGWCKDNPQLFADFRDIKNPQDNPYIYHPQDQRAAFVTNRSLEAASDWLHIKDSIDMDTLTSGLIGTIGPRGAMDLMTFVKIADKLPRLEEIKNNPLGAIVPDNPAAICMVVYRTLACIGAEWLDAWMDYLGRLPSEAQALFVNGARVDTYSKRGVVMTNKKFAQWAMANRFLFEADKV